MDSISQIGSLVEVGYSVMTWVVGLISPIAPRKEVNQRLPPGPTVA
jgi:hypothetical protein